MVKPSDVGWIARDIGARMRELEEAEQAVIYYKNRLKRLPVPVCLDERIELARLLYWDYPRVNAQAVADMLGVRLYDMLRLVGPHASGILCDRCNIDIMVSSRRELAEIRREIRWAAKVNHPPWAEGYTTLCNGCREAVLEQRRVRSRKDGEP